MQKATIPSPSLHGTTSLATALVDRSSKQDRTKEVKDQVTATESTTNEVYSICAFLAQMTIILEKDEPGMHSGLIHLHPLSNSEPRFGPKS